MTRTRPIEELVERVITDAVSEHIGKAAEAFVQEALKNARFQEALRALVYKRSQEILDELQRPQPYQPRSEPKASA